MLVAGDGCASAGRWAGHAAGPAGSVSLEALTGADPTAMTGAALVDAIVASEKALSLLAAHADAVAVRVGGAVRRR